MRIAIAALWLLGCGHAPSSERGQTMTQATNAACQEQLLVFTRLELERWHGLPACSAADATQALGPTDAETPGEFGLVRRYRPRDGAAKGIEVWLDDGRVTLVGASTPRPIDLAALLGAPEAKARSRIFEPMYEQWVWARRGLAAHVAKAGHQPIAIYGFAPTTVEAFLASPVAKVAVREAPLP